MPLDQHGASAIESRRPAQPPHANRSPHSSTLSPVGSGCCFSRPSGQDSPYPDSTTPTSSHAINAQQPSQDPTSTETTDHTTATTQQQPAARRRRRSQQPLGQHINKPLRRHTWTTKQRRWTRSALDRERADFFDTRVTGRPEIWQTLHVVLQVLWEEHPAGSDDDGTGGLATAQSILDAAEITLPTGDLTQGAYDNLGNYYAFHEWIVSDPTDLAPEEDEEAGAEEDEDGKGAVPFEEGEDDEALRRREEKGKGVLNARDLVTVYARLSENARDIKISVATGESVRSVARTVLEESGLPENKRIRIAYMGKILKENASLEDQGWKKGHVVNALVFAR
ncbi:related to ubiquitin domain protein [Cephalotrichum gorgonifer]|uniref:Related to ubiquitin domain protein n=1 Tax=Cephalotrichum gorgonifer TaxID=2041049 RepID=A0AAE8N168_9PEZI|nr:related to ubiquitin domain protein [Cephalotrichum gorgonifer]